MTKAKQTSRPRILRQSFGGRHSCAGPHRHQPRDGLSMRGGFVRKGKTPSGPKGDVSKDCPRRGRCWAAFRKLCEWTSLKVAGNGNTLAAGPLPVPRLIQPRWTAFARMVLHYSRLLISSIFGRRSGGMLPRTLRAIYTGNLIPIHGRGTFHSPDTEGTFLWNRAYRLRRGKRVLYESEMSCLLIRRQRNGEKVGERQKWTQLRSDPPKKGGR